MVPISVLMPNYNNAPFLKEAIDSILNQTFKDFIFIIVDDASTDDSVSIIKSYKDKRILLIEKKNNSGIVDTLNIGLLHVTTKYMVRMDGDDISTLDRLELLYRFMESNPQVDICGSQMMFMGKTTTGTTSFFTDNDLMKAQLICLTPFCHASIILKTHLLKSHQLFYRNDFPFMEDYDLFYQLKKTAHFATIDKVLYHYRVLSHNSTVKNYDTRNKRYRDFYKCILQNLDIPANEKNISLHLEFFITPTLSFSLGEYKQWTELLISQNTKKNLFPHEALKIIIEKRWQHLFFKIADLNFSYIISYLLITKRLNLKQISYLLKLKINKLIGRK
ncbi:MAG TPA: glycosyltransferase family A protein [Bacteroidia bacterium]|nr:glycosyltransferase family A protein [Bacteroidia bacterium]